MYDVSGKPPAEEKARGRMQDSVNKWEEGARADRVSRLSGTIKSSLEQESDYTEDIREEFQKVKKPEPELRFSKDEFDEKLRNRQIKAQTMSMEDYLNLQVEQTGLLKSLQIRFAFCTLLSLILIGLAIVPGSLPFLLNPYSYPAGYIFANLLLLLITGFIGFSTAFRGIVHLFTLKADADSLASLSFYAALIGTGASLYTNFFLSASPAALAPTSILAVCAACGVSLNLLGKCFYVKRVVGNLSLLNSADLSYAAAFVGEETSESLLPGFKGTPFIVKTRKAAAPDDIIRESYAASPSDLTAKALSPTVFAAALLTAVVFGYFHDPLGAAAVFSAICCVASPLLFEFGVACPFCRACGRLAGEDVLLTGSDDVLDFGMADAVIADGSFIFPGKDTRIIGIKTFHGFKVEDAVLAASSIADAGKSPLACAFLDIFADVGIGRKLLKSVQKVKYEDEMGLSCLIDNEVVLLGNRRLMRHHIVDTPSRDYELRYAVNGRDVAYLAINGQVAAIFIVAYGIGQDAAEAIRGLDRYGVSLLISSSDPNITPQLIEEKCGLSPQWATLLDAHQTELLRAWEEQEAYGSGIVFKTVTGYIKAITACARLRGTIWANTVLQTVFAFVGIFFVAVLAFTGGSVPTLFVLCYQLLCAVPVFLISLLRRS